MRVLKSLRWRGIGVFYALAGKVGQCILVGHVAEQQRERLGTQAA